MSRHGICEKCDFFNEKLAKLANIKLTVIDYSLKICHKYFVM